MWPRSAASAMAMPTLLLGGCMAAHHASAPPIRLQEVAGYAFLVPGQSGLGAGASLNTGVPLGKLAAAHAGTCAIPGRVFSLTPPSGAGGWIVTSPSLHGWQSPPPGADLRAEWLGFLRSLAALQTDGCFRPGWNFPQAQQKIAEAIPVPADESLIFAYSFTGTEAVDLFPGMQVQVEHSVYGTRNGKRELQSVQGDYEVVSQGEGVALHRVRTVTLHQPANDEQIFHLDRLTSGAPLLRLFLESAGEVKRPSTLLASRTAGAMTLATQQMEAGGAVGCSAVNAPGVTCITFRSGVSLLLACRANGKVEYHAPGTALSQLLDEHNAALTAVLVRRRQADGSYAPLLFPPTKEAARRILLQNGDEVTWR